MGTNPLDVSQEGMWGLTDLDPDAAWDPAHLLWSYAVKRKSKNRISNVDIPL